MRIKYQGIRRNGNAYGGQRDTKNVLAFTEDRFKKGDRELVVDTVDDPRMEVGRIGMFDGRRSWYALSPEDENE